jgi:peptidoglycan/xylan/chitin deacetylase (PgdA/CDA1 family)
MTNIIKYFSTSRGVKNLVLRIGSVLGRFGFTEGRFERRLNRYCTVTEDLGCVPSFPLTAVTLKRHPGPIKRLSKKGVEFTVHGYIHTDYKLISAKEQARHFQKAGKIFDDSGISFKGFRAPYLRINNMTSEVLSNLGFLYDSSHVIYWDVIGQDENARQGEVEYRRLLDFYDARSACDYLALPRYIDGLIELPVSIPDDEAMVDRLGMRGSQEIANVWQAILKKTYERGELFVVQLHPERIDLCGGALSQTVRQAQAFNPPVWIATLGEIARWWNEKGKFILEVQPEGAGRYRVKASCSEKATLLLRNCKASVPTAEWSYGYQGTSARDFAIESPTRPVIGVEPGSSQEAVNFLKSEGFVVERSGQPGNYGIYLDNLADFRLTDEKSLSERIENSNAPLLRYWRWPSYSQSALAVSGDIDSITLTDFVLRIIETWRQNRLHDTVT